MSHWVPVRWHGGRLCAFSSASLTRRLNACSSFRSACFTGKARTVYRLPARSTSATPALVSGQQVQEAVMAWVHNTLHEFVTTSGRQQPCNTGSSAWRKCTERVDGTKLYEALAPGQHPNLVHDHVLLHEATAIPDSAVSDLAASAALWDTLVENESDMLPHKVLAADLLLKAELPLVDSLRTLMIDQGFEPCDHISQAVAKYRYQRRQMTEGDCIALRECLDTLCAAYDITLEQLYEFETLDHWARERNCCFHPLGRNTSQLDAAAVVAARSLITDSPEFAEVRASSLLLLGILEARLSEASSSGAINALPPGTSAPGAAARFQCQAAALC